MTYNYFVYFQGTAYIPNTNSVSSFSSDEEGILYIEKDQGMEVFDIKRVNLGLGIPGKYSTQYALTEEMYLRWFEYIQAMGANVIRTYTLAHEDFYNAFYKYNKDNEDPLYLIHGVWVDD